ncbi:MAG: CRISPR-associated endonuclease Cas3'' [Polyangiaceae bacterium]|nr:CRISPR-associated endonuclease Cas3'' [Polyangiaceae bacterium]
MGKTLGVLAAWSWHRVALGQSNWPRRLVWCLPMRVLVEQTEAVVRQALDRVHRLWPGRGDHPGKVGVHVLMGGADPGGDWHLFPEECAVLIGTQDMLLSRALNRGYASARARWPLEFGLLNHDALWILDEVQLMDVGLATSAQLQAFHDQDVAKGHRSRTSWWMSATLQPQWLRSVDTASQHDAWSHAPCTVAPEQRAMGLGGVAKSVSVVEVTADQVAQFAERVLHEHDAVHDGENGRITLVICNTVDRACRTYDALLAARPSQEVRLAHSRFRPSERAAWRDSFLSRAACSRGTDRIIVATQVVEAGVDVSAGCVVSELAPWPSLVQRFGRCARYGGSGTVLVVDRGRDDKTALPYTTDDLEAALFALGRLASGSGDVGTASLEEFEESLSESDRGRLYPYVPQHLLLRRELDELFDTTPDLTGADLDISRFIRSGDERDLQVFWLDVPRVPKGQTAEPDRRRRPGREELCNVPFLLARDWLCGSETKSSRKPRLKAAFRAWTWDWIEGRWVTAERKQLVPGRIVCVAAECGGYRLERGFDDQSREAVPVVGPPELSSQQLAEVEADESQDSEDLSASEWKTIACHCGEVEEHALRIAEAVALPDDVRKLLGLAGRWHDLGKAHPAFQGLIRGDTRPDRPDLAKAPKVAWRREYRTLDGRDVRPGLRHELASALALFSVLQRHAPGHPALIGRWREALALAGTSTATEPVGKPPTPCEQAILACSEQEFDLLVYLVASHHGKVRVALHAAPQDQDYRDRDGRGLPIRGVREGDALPSVRLDASAPALPELTLSLEPANLGLSPVTGRSWRERTSELQQRFGPAGLAWLEALLIAADRRASRLTTPDPELAPGAR